MAKIEYFFKNRTTRLCFRLLDLSLKPFFKASLPINEPKAILLCNGAHLGDTILTTALIPPLKAAFPNVRIGMLVASCSKVVLEGHPLLDAVHTFDHWKLHPKKTYLSSRRNALSEIKEKQYDVAIDCPFHFPNCAPLLWQAGIKTRIGFRTAGLSPLLTHSLPWQSFNSVPEAFFALANIFPGVTSQRNKLALCMPHIKKHEKGDYLVFHPGSRNSCKLWPLDHWKSLTRDLLDLGMEIYFTGSGEREKEYVHQIIPQDSKRAHNRVDAISWHAFTELIAKSRLLVSVDTVAGHVAASSETASITLLPEKNSLWKPFAATAHAITLEKTSPTEVKKLILTLLK